MSEWMVNGNRRGDFIGPYKKRTQRMVDMGVAEEHLRKFLPGDCKRCLPIGLGFMLRICDEVVTEQISTEEAISQVVEHTRKRPGPQVDERWYDAPEKCPVAEADTRSRRTDCW